MANSAVYSAATVRSGDSLRIDQAENLQLRESNANIKTRYTGDAFSYTETKEDIAINAWQRFKLWLAEKIGDVFGMHSRSGSMEVVELLFKIIGILLIIFVIYKIVMAYINKNGNWIFGRKSDKLNTHTKSIEDNIHLADFEKKIKESIQEKRFRLAIRYYYLLVLKQLSEKNIIEWDDEKTNYDYYQEIENKDLKNQFKYISYIYNYCWYGEFDIDVNEFESGQKAFQKLIKSV